ncbi:DUF4272 domain-containing protein [Sphingobacterium sp. IITKGP-BTPF85]|uniref:DUF4272 domain-containing protein n=1 Tax=Sphingobacterium sp. IITKGP-BTPF85 TaxID=1338009 RepID=UPI00038A312E|nr:DUF4272 domain-containing protein [Sphingobacterium sp. IITKGP-BTPF85]KKX50142.1 hypothetical protein L950_0212010 [Sphingobacterium sp. IITKGP-BTPF85]
MTEEKKHQIKLENDKIIKDKGYRVNDWLPILETSSFRTLDEIKGRMSVMNALINIAFEAPVYIIKEWLENQNLLVFLSDAEKEILEKDNDELTDIEINSLNWYLESLWALMWATGMIERLAAEDYVGDHMVSLLPNLQHGETNIKLERLSKVRTEIELYTMLDYYYRLHWYCVDERLNGRQAKLNEGVIYERRKSLEWAFNRENDWDNVEMGT